MSKKKYEAPEMDIIKFQMTDIITASTEEFNGEWVPIGEKNSNDGFFFTE